MIDLFELHVLATLFMTGLIWFVQVVHYPLFDRVGVDAFVRYERDHQRLTTWVVAPPMLIELITGVMLAWRWGGTYVAGLIMIAALWTLTAFGAMPLHRRLGDGFDAVAHRRLVRVNWARTALWSARAIVLLAVR